MTRLPSRTWKRLRRMAERPFAAALAFLLFASMVVSLLHIGFTADALATLVPDWLLTALAIAYGIGGGLILLALMFDRSDFEAAGCVLVGNGLLVRIIALLVVFGPTAATIATGVFYIAFGWACVERFMQIVNGDRIIRVHREVKIKFVAEEE